MTKDLPEGIKSFLGEGTRPGLEETFGGLSSRRFYSDKTDFVRFQTAKKRPAPFPGRVFFSTILEKEFLALERCLA
jgi:hypothetical protein